MTAAITDPFLADCRVFSLRLDGELAHGCRSEYRERAYSDELFELCGVPFPPTLDRAVVKRRSDYLAGRLCAQRALERLDPKAPGPVACGTHGEPLWPPGVRGSISHAGGLAVAIVTAAPGVLGLGIDVEQTLPDSAAVDIARQVMDAEEERLVRQSFAQFGRGVSTLFSAKESIFKAAFSAVGRYIDFHAVRAIRIEPAEIVFVVAEPLSVHLPRGIEIRVAVESTGQNIQTATCIHPSTLL